MVMTLLSDIVSLQFSRVSGELQPAFSTRARGPSSPIQFCKAEGIYQHALAVQVFAASCSLPQESSGAVISTAALGIPCPKTQLSCSPGAHFCITSDIK